MFANAAANIFEEQKTYTPNTFEFISEVYNFCGFVPFDITPSTVGYEFYQELNTSTGVLSSDFSLYDYVVPGLYGGYCEAGFTDSDATANRARLVKPAYLQVGDIIVLYDQSQPTLAQKYCAYLYVDADHIYSIDTGVPTLKISTFEGKETGEKFLEQLEAYTFYFVLRPAIK